MLISQKVMRYLTIITTGVASIFLIGSCNSAFAASDQFETHTINGSDLNNNPLVAKILSEIEYSKQQIAQIEKNQKDKETADKLIAQQRQIAKTLEDQALQILQTQTAVNSSKNSFTRFVNTINNTSVQNVFWGEFNFTSQRIDAGHAAMKQVLANGGTWEEAMQEFSKYAGIKRVEMIEVNKNLNIQYGLADEKTQAQFDQNGRLPDDYIKVPDTSTNHT